MDADTQAVRPTTDYNPLQVIVAWIVLVASTLFSWFVGGDHGFASAIATTLVIAIAIAKCVIIGLLFMEIKGAPRVLRIWLAIFCGFVLCGVLGPYFLVWARPTLHSSEGRHVDDAAPVS